MSYNPWRDVAQRYPEVHIEWHSISPAQAFWARGSDVILVDDSISRVERRCALAHEIAHMDVGDKATNLCWFTTRMENEADKLACRRLIDAVDLAEVLRWCQSGTEVAGELGVTLAFLQLRWTWMDECERELAWRTIRAKESAA